MVVAYGWLFSVVEVTLSYRTEQLEHSIAKNHSKKLPRFDLP